MLTARCLNKIKNRIVLLRKQVFVCDEDSMFSECSVRVSIVIRHLPKDLRLGYGGVRIGLAWISTRVMIETGGDFPTLPLLHTQVTFLPKIITYLRKTKQFFVDWLGIRTVGCYVMLYFYWVILSSYLTMETRSCEFRSIDDWRSNVGLFLFSHRINQRRWMKTSLRVM